MELKSLLNKTPKTPRKKTKSEAEEIVTNIIVDWRIRDPSTFKYTQGDISVTNLDRVLAKMGMVSSKKWKNEDKIEVIAFFFDLAPNWFDGRSVFAHGAELPTFLDWMSLAEQLHAEFKWALDSKIITKQEDIDHIKVEKEWTEGVIEFIEKTVRDKLE